MKRSDYRATKEFILHAEVPKETSTYKPFYHEKLIDLTLEGIQNAGFKLNKETYTAYNDGQVASGRYTISNVADEEMQLEIGWQNSYDKSRTLKFALGTQIFICGNGSVHGSFGAFKKKHTGDIQLFTPHTITDYIKSAGDTFITMQEDRDLMKQIEVDKRITAELVGRMLIEEEILSTMQVNVILKQLTHPSFDYKAPGSLWELYNHTTYALKDTKPGLWIDSHIAANTLFVNAAGELGGGKLWQEPSVTPHVDRQLSIFFNSAD